MAHVLIVYGTTEGQTAKISETLAREISSKGHRVRTFPASEAPTGKELEAFDAIIVGSSVHIGKFDKALRKWVGRNFVFIHGKPSAFFSVCLGILEKNLKAKREEAEIVANFFREAGWSPELHTIFAGALKYSQYGWLKKLLMKNIAGKAGGDTDTSRDYEYTNWDEVRAFAQRFETLLEHLGTIPAVSIGKH
ncbi:MAG: flavodoxin domain-containing protein [Bdellovibrionota bacterium]